jgi:hypothetical protein
VSDSTTNPYGRSDGSVPGTTETLLAPGFASTTADLAPGLGGSGSCPGCGTLGVDDLIEDVEVGLDAKDLGVERDISARIAI